MKTITLQFTIPDEVDTPSETLLKMRQMLLEAIHITRDDKFLWYSDEEQDLIDALLTES